MADANATILPQGAGYGVVVGIGFFFAFLMTGVSWVQVALPPSFLRPYIHVARGAG